MLSYLFSLCGKDLKVEMGWVDAGEGFLFQIAYSYIETGYFNKPKRSMLTVFLSRPTLCTIR